MRPALVIWFGYRFSPAIPCSQNHASQRFGATRKLASSMPMFARFHVDENGS
jgi:hypothetical protein